MKKTLTFFLFLTVSMLLQAQTDSLASDTIKNWKTESTININFNQTGVKNWAAGGQSAINFGTIFKVGAEYKKNKVSWTNSLEWIYGIGRTGGDSLLFKKNNDQLSIKTNFGYKIKNNFGVAALAELRSQILPTYNYQRDTIGEKVEKKNQIISEIFAPAYILTAIGADYKYKSLFSLNVSPLTGKTTIVTNDRLSSIGAFGVDSNETVRFELGTLVKFGIKFQPFKDSEVLKNINFSSDLTLFSAYETYGTIDVNWETLTVFKINKYFNTTFSTNLIYDEDVNINREDGTVGPTTQLRNVLNIGVSINL